MTFDPMFTTAMTTLGAVFAGAVVQSISLRRQLGSTRATARARRERMPRSVR